MVFEIENSKPFSWVIPAPKNRFFGQIVFFQVLLEWNEFSLPVAVIVSVYSVNWRYYVTTFSE